MVTTGADVNAQGGEYRNALCAASAEGHETMVRSLLENGTDINAQVERTAMHSVSHQLEVMRRWCRCYSKRVQISTLRIQFT